MSELTVKEQVFVVDGSPAVFPVEYYAFRNAEDLGQLFTADVVIHFEFAGSTFAYAIVIVMFKRTANLPPEFDVILAEHLQLAPRLFTVYKLSAYRFQFDTPYILNLSANCARL